MAKIERSLRAILSSWPVWMLIAYLGLAGVVVALFFLFGRTAKEEASRTATAKAAAVAQVGQCFTAVKNAPVVAGFIRSHEAVIDNGLITNRAAIAATPGDPLNVVRRAAIDRLTEAKENADQLKRLIDASTPTKQKCVKLATSLHVDPSRYLRQLTPN